MLSTIASKIDFVGSFNSAEKARILSAISILHDGYPNGGRKSLLAEGTIDKYSLAIEL